MKSGIILNCTIAFYDSTGDIRQFVFIDESIDCYFRGLNYGFEIMGMYYHDECDFDFITMKIKSSYELYQEFIDALNDEKYLVMSFDLYPKPYNEQTADKYFYTLINLRYDGISTFTAEEKFDDINDPSTKYLLFEYKRNK